MAQNLANPENHPKTTSLPPSLQRVVAETYRGGEYKWRPSEIPASLRTIAVRVVADLDRELMPVERDWLSGRIATLLGHYWTPKMGPELRVAMAHDWINILGHLSRSTIERACRSYLETTEKFGPTPGQILELAEAHIADKTRQRDRLRQCLDYRPGARKGRGEDTPEQKAAALKSVGGIIDKLKREVEAETGRDGGQGE